MNRAVSTKSLCWLALSLLCVVLASGCSTYADRVRRAHTHFYLGELEPAAETLSEYIDSHPRDADAASLDLAMVQLVSGQPDQAERTLRTVRDNLDELEQSDALEMGLSMLTDDQRLAYSGHNYEKVLTRVFLALTNLMNDGQDAEAYTLQVNAKQAEFLEKVEPDEKEQAKQIYTPLAVGPYLRGMIRESSFGNYDDATRAYAQVVSWQPDFQAAKLDLQRAQNGVHSQPGHGVLYVFALVNRGPVKEETVEIPTTVAMLLADRILSSVGEYDVPPTLAPIKVPRVVVPPRDIANVSLVIDHQVLGQTETICDIADLAKRQEEIEFPHIMARAIARRIVKKAAIYATKDVVEADQPWADLALSAVGVAWEATEAADTRCWALLPREIQVIRVELRAGRHQIELTPSLTSGRQSAGPTGEVEIGDGRNTYLLACFPGPRAVGQILQRMQ